MTIGWEFYIIRYVLGRFIRRLSHLKIHSSKVMRFFRLIVIAGDAVKHLFF